MIYDCRRASDSDSTPRLSPKIEEITKTIVDFRIITQNKLLLSSYFCTFQPQFRCGQTLSPNQRGLNASKKRYINVLHSRPWRCGMSKTGIGVFNLRNYSVGNRYQTLKIEFTVLSIVGAGLPNPYELPCVQIIMEFTIRGYSV